MTARRTLIAALIIVAAAAAFELTMGRHPICTCGTIELWVGTRDSPKTSQMLVDWYSLSHVVHGLLFYALLWLLFRRWSFERRFLIAILIEAGWEVIENTPMVIDRYRAVTVSFGYTGDSVLNSMGDIGCMILGFLFASRLPWRVSFAVAVIFELLTLYVIRDNLTLNVVMLFWPIEAIRQWQAAS